MRVKEVMTKDVVSVLPRATVAEALDLMVRYHVSGLPVVDGSGSLVGVVSETDFMRRPELGTQEHGSHWFECFFMPGRAAQTYAHTHARRVNEVMSVDVATVNENAGLEEAIALMERRRVKRLPVVAGRKVVGIIARSDFVRTLALFVRQSYEEAMSSDFAIKQEIETELNAQKWAPVASIGVDVKDGVVRLRGSLSDERQRNAIVALVENVDGVLAVHDHMEWIGAYLGAPILSTTI